MATIGTLIVELAGNVARLEADLKQAGKHVQNTERLIQDSVNKMNGFFGLLGVTLSAGAFVHFIKGTIDSADALVDLHEKTGTSIKDLAGLKFAAEQNSTSLEAVAMAGKKLSVSLVEHPALFRQMGVTATDSTGAMIQLADVFATMPDGVQKTALAVKLMGKNGEEMIPFMNQGSASLRDYIDKGREYSHVTEDSARAAKQFNDRVAELKAQSEGLGMSLANVLVPNLSNTATAMNDLVREGHPVLALWRALAGMGQIPWDFLMPPENLAESLKSANRLKELKSELAGIQNNLAETGGRGGLVGKWLHGTREEQIQQAEMLKNQIATIEQHAAELDKRTSAAAAAGGSGKGGQMLDALGGAAPSASIGAGVGPNPGDKSLADQLAADFQKNQADLFGEGAGMDVAARDQEAYDRKIEAAQFYHEKINSDASAYAQMRELIESDHQARLVALGRQGALSREQFEKLSGKSQLLITTGIMQTIIGASAQHSQAMFSMMKAAKLAEAAITLPKTVMDAYAAGMVAGGPFGPAVGAAYAALAFSAQMIQMNAIRSASFGGGGGGSAPSGGGVSSIAIPGQDASPGIVAASAPTAAPKPGVIVNINVGDDGMYSATAVRNLIEKINEQIADGATIDQIRVN